LSRKEEVVHPPLVFVHLGPEVPRYAHATLQFAASRYEGEVFLLTDSEMRGKNRARYLVDHILTWYDRGAFLRFRDKSSLDASFREGFWLHVVERFFVLRQFMDRVGIDKLFHAELDVMVFDLEGVAAHCDQHGGGIFAVMDAPNRALASLFYVNSSRCFDSFLDFVVNNADAKNEMSILGKFLQELSSCGHALPSDRVFDREANPLSPSMVSDSVGLFDASAFGQWLFGIDPRNVEGFTRNKFHDGKSNVPFRRLRFKMDYHGKRLSVAMRGGETFQIRSLHVHSKITRRLSVRLILRTYLWLNRLPFRVLVTVSKGTIPGIVLKALLRGRALRFLQTRSQRSAHLAKLVLGYLRKRSSLHLSRRQQIALRELLSNGTRSTYNGP